MDEKKFDPELEIKMKTKYLDSVTHYRDKGFSEHICIGGGILSMFKEYHFYNNKNTKKKDKDKHITFCCDWREWMNTIGKPVTMINRDGGSVHTPALFCPNCGKALKSS